MFFVNLLNLLASFIQLLFTKLSTSVVTCFAGHRFETPFAFSPVLSCPNTPTTVVSAPYTLQVIPTFARLFLFVHYFDLNQHLLQCRLLAHTVSTAAYDIQSRRVIQMHLVFSSSIVNKRISLCRINVVIVNPIYISSMHQLLLILFLRVSITYIFHMRVSAAQKALTILSPQTKVRLHVLSIHRM